MFHSEPLPVCVSISSLQHLDDLGQQVGGVSGAQQVQQNLLAVFIIDDLIQRRHDLLDGRDERFRPFTRLQAAS